MSDDYPYIYFDAKNQQFRFVQCRATLDGKPDEWFIYSDEKLSGKWCRVSKKPHWHFVGIL